MSRRARYFPNPWLGAGSGEQGGVEREEVAARVSSLATWLEQQQGCGRRDLQGGLYVGAAGVGYALLRAGRTQAAQRLVSAHASSVAGERGPDSAGWLLGAAGVWGVQALIARRHSQPSDDNCGTETMFTFRMF